MIRVNILESKMKLMNKTQSELAKELNMSISSLNKRFNEKIDFRAKEISVIKNILKLSSDDIDVIFLEKKLTES